jgi:hypothetical protein
MTSEVAKTISTCTIWLSVAMTLTGGLFTMHGYDAAFFVVVTALIMGAATAATAIVWHAKAIKSPTKSPVESEL